MKKIVFALFFLFLAAFCAFLIFRRKAVLLSEQEVFREEISAMDAAGVLPEENGPENGAEIGPESASRLSEAVRTMQEEFPGFFGRLIVKDTCIDYPVMLPPEEDPQWYLHRDIHGAESSSGSIYADPATILYSRVLILYGHHMKDGSMFGSLGKYLDPGFAAGHPAILLTAAGGEEHYRPSAVLILSAEDESTGQALSFLQKEDPKTLAQAAEKTGILYRMPDPEKKHLVLVTCEYSVKDGRLAVLFDED